MSSRIEIAGWRLTLALPSGFEQIMRQLVAEVLCAAEGRSVAPMRRSRRAITYNCRVTSPTEKLPIFVKVIAAARGTGRIKRNFRRSGAAHSAQITAQILAAGFCAPPIWLWGEHAPTGREIIVSPRARGYGPLRTLSLLAGEPQAKWRLLRALGEEIARFHRAGFVHGDLTPFNLFLSPDETPCCVLLDNERTRRSRLWLWRRQARNLVQLGRFALPAVSSTDRMRVLCSYARTRPLDEAAVKRIAKMLQRRVGRQGGLERIEVPASGEGTRRAAN